MAVNWPAGIASKGNAGVTGPRGPRGAKGDNVFNNTWNNEKIPPILKNIRDQINKRNKEPEKKNPPIYLNLKTPSGGKGEITAKYRVLESFQLHPYNYSNYYI